MQYLALRIAEEHQLKGKALNDFNALVQKAQEDGAIPPFWYYRGKSRSARKAFKQLRKELTSL